MVHWSLEGEVPRNRNHIFNHINILVVVQDWPHGNLRAVRLCSTLLRNRYQLEIKKCGSLLARSFDIESINQKFQFSLEAVSSKVALAISEGCKLTKSTTPGESRLRLNSGLNVGEKSTCKILKVIQHSFCKQYVPFKFNSGNMQFYLPNRFYTNVGLPQLTTLPLTMGRSIDMVCANADILKSINSSAQILMIQKLFQML